MFPISRDPHRYDDMLHLPHHVSPCRLPMPRQNRAAQFAPFDALNGYSAAIRETARHTDPRAELDDSAKLRLNDRLRHLLQSQHRQPAVTVTWFRPDTRKSGGSYPTISGNLKKIDVFRGLLLLTDDTSIPLEDIFRLDSDLFTCLDDLA